MTTAVNDRPQWIAASVLQPDGKLAVAGAAWTGWDASTTEIILARYQIWSSPAALDLQADSDTGSSSADNVTSDATPTLEVPVPAEAGGFRIYRDGVPVSGAYQPAGAPWTSPTLPDGTSNFTYTAVDLAGNETPRSVPLAVTVDRAAPTAAPADFNFQTLPHRLTFRFSEDVSKSLTLDDVKVQRPGAAAGAAPAPTSLKFDAKTNTATFSFAAPVPDGDYRATLSAAGVSDAAGNALASDSTLDFFFLGGDVNHDRQVTQADLAIVTSNLGRKDATFAQGDVDYSETVTDADRNLVTAALGRTLPPPAVDVPLEAESATIAGAIIAKNQPGYGGSGFVDFQHATGDFVEWSVNAAAAGMYRLDFRYANGSASDRPLQLSVDGQAVLAQLSFPPTGSWTKWKTAQATVSLPAGASKVRLTAVGSNGANIDSLTVHPTTVAQSLEAESATIAGPVISAAHPGYTGGGFVDFIHPSGDYLEFSADIPVAGSYTLDFRYANGSAADRPLELKVNGSATATPVSFAPTGSWSNWRSSSVVATLASGVNKIRLTAVGLSGANIDALTLMPRLTPAGGLNATFGIRGLSTVDFGGWTEIEPTSFALFGAAKLDHIAQERQP